MLFDDHHASGLTAGSAVTPIAPVPQSAPFVLELTPFDPDQTPAARRIRAALEKQLAKAAKDAARQAKQAEKAAAKAAREAADRPTDISTDQFAGPADLPAALSDLAAGVEVSLDLETTALTPWVVSERPGAATRLGNGVTKQAYARRYACSFARNPRARILSLQVIPSGTARAFDLDRLSQTERESLVTALTGKVWVGHNLAFDLMWLRSIVPTVEPKALVDTMLLSMTHTPEFEFAVRDLMGSPTTPGWLCEGGVQAHWGLPDVLALGSDAYRHMQSMLSQRDARNRAVADGEPGRALPLDFLSVALLGEKLDKAFQKPHNWMPDVLTTGHYDYCIGDISQPPKIARILLGLPPSASKQKLLDAIAENDGALAYGTFMRGAIRLTQMQRNGLYMSPVATGEYIKKYTAEAAAALDKLLADLPDLAHHKDTLLAPDKGLTNEVKEAFACGLTRLTGIAPDRTETGSPKLNAKELKMRYRDLPALTHYNALTGALKRASMARAYLVQADSQSRLHSMVSIATVTGRTASQEPNLQNAPRGQDFRALFAAPPGKKIIAVDYSAIEMRIAAALTVRAYRAFRGVIDSALRGDARTFEVVARYLGAHWYMGDLGKLNKDGSLSAIDALVYLMRHGEDHPDAIIEPGERPMLEGSRIEDWRDYYSGMLYAVVRKMRAAGAFQTDAQTDRLPLADVFARGLDPHIITALSTESAAGRFDLQGQSPTEFVAALSPAEADALKKQLKGPRQAAKAQNFGLLYGMQGEKLHAYGITNYGLNWTPDEAEFAAQAWFDLYPEVRLWHLLTRAKKRKLFADTLTPAKLFTATTLSGRPVCSDKLPSALNFQDQGTGAEIALAAIAALPDHLACELVNFVHDELVFEVPEDQADARVPEINRVMIEAADKWLKTDYGVPTEVEAAVGDFWIH